MYRIYLSIARFRYSDAADRRPLLPDAATRLHYLLRRGELAAHANIYGDEADFLALYLDTTFNIGDFEFSSNLLDIWGLSHKIVRYFVAGIRGHVVEKPKLRLTKRWRAALERLQRTRPPKWVEVTFALLEVPPSVQSAFNERIKDIRANASKRKKRVSLGSFHMHGGPTARPFALGGIVYRQIDRAKAEDFAFVTAAEAMEQAGVTAALVIGEDMTTQDFPYTILGLVGTSLARRPIRSDVR